MTFLLALLLAQSAPPLIIDTDAGTDDLLAICYLLSRPDVHIEAITVVGGVAHVHEGALNILHILDVANRPDIKVYEGDPSTPAGGTDFPAEWRKLADEVFGPHPTLRSPEKGAAQFLSQRAQKPCRILALGPLTNIAAAFGFHGGPAIIVMMGGAIRVPGNVADGGIKDNPHAEWNIFADPRAAQSVFGSGTPIQLIPLDATNHVPINAAYLARFEKEATTPLGKVAAHLLAGSKPLMDSHIFYAWDPLAAVAFAHPEVVSYKPIAIRITASGRTEELSGKPTNVEAALNANPALFEKLFLEPFALAPKNP